MIKTEALRRRERRQALLTVVFTIISVIYLMPVLLVLINSLKANAFVNTETFKLPTAESFVGLKNYVKGMTFGNFAFYKVVFYSFFITITSTALILLCTSMAAWYISRVGSLVSKIVYYLCVFSMVVPFQMVMYTLARTADQVHLNTPWTIPVVYLGFGAGLAVFMFTGFVKSLPLEIEEAALKKETDKLSQEHLAEIQKELSDMRDEFNAKKAQWDNEKAAITKVQKLREENRNR